MNVFLKQNNCNHDNIKENICNIFNFFKRYRSKYICNKGIMLTIKTLCLEGMVTLYKLTNKFADLWTANIFYFYLTSYNAQNGF